MHILTDVNSDIKILNVKNTEDGRGTFNKIYNMDDCGKYQIDNLVFREIYYTVSAKNTIRGMHFQIPPYEQDKLVHVVNGTIIDVVVDLRKGSPYFQKYMAIELSAADKKAIYIPAGFAHGFVSYEENTLLMYCVTSVYEPKSDCGIDHTSIGYDWKIDNPLVSDRDKTFPNLRDYRSPF